MPGVLILISSEIGSGLRTTLGLPMLFECMGICVVSTAHESELGDCCVHMCIWWKINHFFFFKFS